MINDAIDLRKASRFLFAALALWGVGVSIAAITGLYRALPTPAIGPLVALGVAAPFAIYLWSANFRHYIEAIGLRGLTIFHVWRIAAAMLFFWYGAHALLPQAFVRDAAWGDLVTGLFAGALAFVPESRNRYLAFHLFGFADLVLAAGTGLVLTLLHDPRMDAIRVLPLALIPLFGVGVSGASHLMAFDLLRRRAGMTPEGEAPLTQGR